MATLDVVVGGQFGSEGKGHVTAQVVKDCLAHQRNTLNIRVAGPNAGHCVVDRNGVKHALRSVPVGAAVDDAVNLYLAPGSEIDLDVLETEVEALRAAGHLVTNLYVSAEATILTEAHKATEADRQMHRKIGSTGKGIGAARADRIMRTAARIADSDRAIGHIERGLGGQIVENDLEFIETWLQDPQASVVIEGTQGYGLGLHAGYYPQCTSSDTRACDFLAMAGISPWNTHITSLTVWVAARVYPIRVAGNSGPLQGETTWDELGLDPEYTTVTHKVRRVGQWDPTLIRNAVLANGGPSPCVQIALTMADQKIPEIAGFEGSLRTEMEAFPSLAQLVWQVEHDAQAKVAMVTTSDRTALWGI